MASEFYNLKFPTTKGEEFDFSQLKDKVVLVVNTASQCGFTPQYAGLQRLHDKYKDEGLVILGFPSNQFGAQEPGSDEQISEFCTINHGVTFQLMKKSDVNGDGTNPVYKYLKSQKSQFGLSRIKWNFEKFLVDRNGKVVSRYISTSSPDSLNTEIERLLAEKPAVKSEL
ncbi:Glutathione peroxidase 2 [Tulasnella sp. 424]|nr:Glutathione peroxidase 2 [Tulasnella sp. 424]KAG8974126.1 Glutathione peroxidase 2 [Tulasnella sp. 425]